VASQRFLGELVDERVDQRGRCGQAFQDRGERRGAERQTFGVTRETEGGVHAFAHDVGQIVEVERGQQLGAVDDAQIAEEFRERLVGVEPGAGRGERVEARPLGQVAAACDQPACGIVAPL